MENNNNTPNGFSYTYSAREQAEVKRIREKYTAPTESEDKMTRLRRLDAGVTQTAQVVALMLGIIGTLALGFGMSLIMSDLPVMLGLSGGVAMVLGVAVGAAGAALAGLAWPVYNAVVKAKRQKLAPEIIRLTDELMR